MANTVITTTPTYPLPRSPLKYPRPPKNRFPPKENLSVICKKCGELKHNRYPRQCCLIKELGEENLKKDKNYKEIVIKNRFDKLPSELIIYIQSFAGEKESHQASYQKLYLDKTFITRIWGKFFKSLEETEVDEDYTCIEIGNYLRGKFPQILPSDILIEAEPPEVGENFSEEFGCVIKKLNKNYLFSLFNEGDIIKEVKEYLNNEGNEAFIHIDLNLLAINYKQSAKDMGFNRWDLRKLQGEENNETIKKLIDINGLATDIAYHHIDDFAYSVFGNEIIKYMDYQNRQLLRVVELDYEIE